LAAFYADFGGEVNGSSAAIYEGQKAGYMTGGSVSLRSKLHNSQLVSVQLPRFEAGCGGIDIYTGGISFISKDEFVSTLKSIGSASLGYAFMLGLESVSPQIVSSLRSMQGVAMDINNSSINSCEVAAGLVGSVWPKRQEASQQICRTLGSKTGMMWDYVTARHDCANEAQYQSALGRAQDSSTRHALGDQFNVAWEAIKQQNIHLTDPELAHLLMSLMGTWVMSVDENGTHINTYPSLLSRDGFLNMLMNGGTSEFYTCARGDEVQCLNVVRSRRTIQRSGSWVGRVEILLKEMQRRILSDQELSEEQKELLTKTRLPLFKFVNVMTARNPRSCLVDLTSLSEVVAVDMLTQHLRESVEIVRQGTQHLCDGQDYAGELFNYLDRLVEVESNISQIETRNMRLMEQEFALMQRIEHLEKEIATMIRL
jgi:conjugative transfer pilus assembly protein TraH